MKELISKAWALPIPGKAMIGMVLAGGVFGILYALQMPQLAYFAGIAIAVLVFVLAAVAMLMKKLDKGKAKAVEAKVSENAATTGGVNKVADRAKLDDMRRQFETGIQTFKDYGKDLYSMPWYALVGEPGSGKTEAIRHSGIGFPPGLQDQLQGTGGTVNMNWWFTDHAVLLDTAGRLMFEEVAPGDTNEWREFLKLLRTVRSNCPMNGMLLVIPADTLITDDPDKIEKKAGKIAQQFDQIQRTLGVRFPVFVLITKSDLINGFREFFDDITDPVLTAQMLGWSNPAGLDEPFRPDRVEEHLQEVRQRLLERRFALLQDPIHTEDSRGRRVDQVDALYKFPEALAELGPRLRRYLEMIFVAGEWSQKPLFLRGIYFTSSMREGDALDADLANVLGVGVESLPEGKLWERERSYFLRDMFLDKVFKERGLVTRAANAGKVKRKRSMILLAAGSVTALLLAGLLWYSYDQTTTRISNPTKYWVSVRDWLDKTGGNGGSASGVTDRSLSELISTFWIRSSNREFTWDSEISIGGNDVDIQGAPRTYDKLFVLARDHYVNNSSSAGMFGLIAHLPGGGGDVFESQLRVQRRLFEESMLVPAIGYTRDDLLDEPGDKRSPDWSSDGQAAGVLTSLLSLEADRVLRRDEPGETFDLSSLVRFFLRESGGAAGVEGGDSPGTDNLEGLVAYFDWLYSEGKSWPPESGDAGSERSELAIDAGIEAFINYYRNPMGEGTAYGELRSFRDAARRFGDDERRLHLGTVFQNVSATEGDYLPRRDEWRGYFAGLEESERTLSAAYTDEVRAVLGESDPAALQVMQDTVRDGLWSNAQQAYDALLAVFGAEDDVSEEKEAHSRLLGWRTQLNAAKFSAKEAYDQQVADLFRQLQDEILGTYVTPPRTSPDKMAFEVRFEAYRDADDWLKNDSAPGGPLRDSFDSIGTAERERVRGVDGAIPSDGEDVMADAHGAVMAVAHAVARFQRTTAIGAEIGSLGGFESRFDGLDQMEFPGVRFSGLERLSYPPHYQPGANADVLAAFALIGESLGATGDGAPPAVLDADRLKEDLAGIERALAAHVDRYLDFWTDEVPTALAPRKPDDLSWGQYRSIATQDERVIAESVREVGDLVYSAVENAKGFLGDQESSREYLEALETERGGRDKLDDDREDMLNNWIDLPSSAGTAGDQLVAAADRNNFLDRYFLVRTDDRPGVAAPEMQYWSGFAEIGLETLTSDASGDTAARIQEAEGLARRFPLTLDAATGNELVIEDLERFVEVTRVWDLSVVEDHDAEEPYATFPDHIALSLISLRGDTLLSKGGRAGRLLRAQKVADYLIKSDGKIEITLASLGYYAYEPNEGTREHCRNLLVTGKKPAKIDEDARLKSALSWDLPLDRGLELQFKDHDGKDTASGRLSRWGPLASLVSRSIDERDVVGARADIWPLPISVEHQAGSGVFWIGVQFDNADGLEDLRDDWLRMDHWSRD